MTDLVAWLVAELDRVEELARAACPVRQPVANGEIWSVEEYAPSAPNAVQTGAWVVTGPGGENGVAFVQGDRRARHIALHDPVAVLRRVAADRQILAEHELEARAFDPSQTCYCCRNKLPELVVWCATCHSAESVLREAHLRGDAGSPCRTVLLLARAWGWTEDAA